MSKTELEYYLLPVDGGFKIVKNGPDGVFYHTDDKGNHAFFGTSFKGDAQKRCDSLNKTIKKK